eukprot:1194443-Prorocentrum_minimum.AAC.3
MAYMEQETFLFEMSIKDNISIGLDDVTDEDLKELLLLASLTQDVKDIGLDFNVGTNGQVVKS